MIWISEIDSEGALALPEELLGCAEAALCFARGPFAGSLALYFTRDLKDELARMALALEYVQ
ncbi:hypothetical protein [Fimbriimonas ginsengisoli]|uniref:Uncharacterized protein n=1 Tax=Fimbriimonas ginsengisoli Gsoil 348 TaxID=661478 RepID=A0A068NQU5_FIMGI|nr:hypothetical protein [Fimbriimonas ginsengisoli]AIE85095.1 hypothetical protein OP10G_1727 [Fimbriimonas ginsengisoli Gsoil 348]